jgi:arsenate reductase (glutaredoxin)
VDQASAVELMLAHPTLVKRPVIVLDDGLLLGFSAQRLAAALLPAEAR